VLEHTQAQLYLEEMEDAAEAEALRLDQLQVDMGLHFKGTMEDQMVLQSVAIQWGAEVVEQGYPHCRLTQTAQLPLLEVLGHLALSQALLFITLVEVELLEIVESEQEGQEALGGEEKARDLMVLR
jgi:hypothetical protein